MENFVLSRHIPMKAIQAIDFLLWFKAAALKILSNSQLVEGRGKTCIYIPLSVT